jgi:hypothetical protein
MSLIITSNVNLDDDLTQSNIFKPYSYTNSLNNNIIKIPPNSEIALESAKINKSGVFTLSNQNDSFGLYYGKKLVDGTFNLNDSTGNVMIGNIGNIQNGDYLETNVNDLAFQIEKGMLNTISHPSIVKGLDDGGNVIGGLTCNASYNASTLDFEGYSWKITQHTDNETSDASLGTSTGGVTNLTGVDDNNNVTYDATAGLFTLNTNKPTQVRFDAYPITNNGFTGVAASNETTHEGIEFDITAANTAGAKWCVGLVRPNIASDFNDNDDAIAYLPTYFDAGAEMPASEGLFAKNQYWDYCVRRIGNNLRVFQSCFRSSRTSGNRNNLVLNPIIYWGAHNTNFNAEYDIGVNASNFVKFKFSISNEKVVIQAIDNKGIYFDLVNQDQAVTPLKKNVATPVNICQWHMFPSVFLNKATTITISNYYVYEALEGSYSAFDENLIYWRKLCNAGLSTTFGQSIENRRWNNQASATVRTPLGVDANGVMDDSQLIFTLAPSELYGNIVTAPTNSQYTFGFIGRSLVDTLNASTVTTQTIQSDIAPKLISNVSLFIRLNNFSQNCTNARRGTSTSKIVAHLPRFDNSGNETGGLYFQPNQRVYLKLNNPSELLINQVDVDIVYDNEQLCQAITGKTIIVFHIQDSK